MASAVRVSFPYKVQVEKTEEGHLATCQDLPGCVAEGKTEAEAVQSFQDAAEGYLRSVVRHHERLPSPSEPEGIEVLS